MNLGTAQVIRANSRNLPLADNSVDLVVTSPPYFALRSYQDGGEHYAGQIGDEPTPDEFVSSLLEVTAECVRVLKPSGSLWVNLGDKYAGGGGQWDKDQREDVGGRRTSKTTGGVRAAYTGGKTYGLRPKSLLGIPWRYALRCIDDLGLILRAEVIWSKPNGLPESVTDRVRRSHEQWFHFTLSPRYFSAVDGIREPHTWGRQINPEWRKSREDWSDAAGAGTRHGRDGGLSSVNPLGKLPGSVWAVDDGESLLRTLLSQVSAGTLDPIEAERLLRAGFGIHVGDDAARGQSVPNGGLDHLRTGSLGVDNDVHDAAHGASVDPGSVWTVPTEPLRVPDHLGIDHFAAFPTEWPKRIIQGWTEPGMTVLDPFGGTGTTAMVAKALGRHGISVDMSADYCRLAEWRTNDRDQLAKVLGIAKADQEPDDAPDLFGLLGDGAA